MSNTLLGIVTRITAMAQTFDIGPLFFQVLELRPGPLLHTGVSQEIEEPYRRSDVLVVRIPFTGRGIAVGWWKESGFDEVQALETAIAGHGLDVFDIDLEDEDVRDQIRANVAKNSSSLDEEWQILNALGVEL